MERGKGSHKPHIQPVKVPVYNLTRVTVQPRLRNHLGSITRERQAAAMGSRMGMLLLWARCRIQLPPAQIWGSKGDMPNTQGCSPSSALIEVHRIIRFGYKQLQCPVWAASYRSPLPRQKYFLSGSNNLLKVGISTINTHLKLKSHLNQGKRPATILYTSKSFTKAKQSERKV